MDVKNQAPGTVQIGWATPDAIDPAAGWQVLVLPEHTVYRVKPKARPQTFEATFGPVDLSVPHRFIVQRVRNGSTTDIETSEEQAPSVNRVSGWWVGSSALVVGLFALAGVICLIAGMRQHATTAQEHALRSLAVAFLVLFVATLALTLVHARSYGLWRMIIGHDNRVSTSATTTVLWTFLVAFALAYFVPRTWLYGEKSLFDGFTPGVKGGTRIWDDYLVLLGGPFAALVSAKGIVGSKLAKGTLQKSTAAGGTASVKQALTDDSGDVDLVDSQYLIFNLVALTYVVFGLASTNQLPAVPSLLLALTGSAAATYVVAKGVRSSPPIIRAVTPGRVRIGDTVTISGSDLTPTSTSAAPQVDIGGIAGLVAAGSTASSVRFDVPLGAPEGLRELSVVTAAGATTSTNIEVLPDTPVVTAVLNHGPGAERVLTVKGAGFTDRFDADHTVTVELTGPAAPTIVRAEVHDLNAGLQSVEVPAPGLSGPVTVEVLSARGQRSPRFALTLP